VSDSPTNLLRRLGAVTPLARGVVVVSAFASALSSVAIIAQALAIARVVGDLFASPHRSLASALIVLAVASALRAGAGALSTLSAGRLSSPLRRDLRRRALESVLSRGPRSSSDATIQLATRGVEAVEAYLARYVPALAASVVAPALFVAWLFSRDWLSGTIVIVCVALLPLFMALLGAEAKVKMQASWDEQQRLAGYFGDVMRGMATLKAFNRSRDAVASLAAVGRSLRESTMATLRVAFLSSFALELLSSLATALVALFLGVRLLHGDLGLERAVAILIVTPEVFLPLRRVAAAYHASATGVAAGESLLDSLDAIPRRGNRAPQSAPTLEVVDPRESTRRVTIRAGGLLLVTGASGAGKSSLLRRLCTLSPPEPGTVFVDGVDLSEIDAREWRERVAWLAQDPRVSGATVREAVALGDPTITDEQVREALTVVGLDVDVERPLGEAAATLSAGERRRLGLARCLVRQPLVLVLDEPTAHLDPRGGDELATVIAALPMTRVVASHRPFASDATLSLAAP
jgi:ATP-binding cassette, subfamily C, bacterial CydCD